MDQPRVDENLQEGTVVGTVLALDQDTVTDLKFSLVDSSNGQFRLDNNVTCNNVIINGSKY